jgi:hypothetical protein
MDYNKDDPNENDFIESTKEFSKDVINKQKKKAKNFWTKQKTRLTQAKHFKIHVKN